MFEKGKKTKAEDKQPDKKLLEEAHDIGNRIGQAGIEEVMKEAGDASPVSKLLMELALLNYQGQIEGLMVAVVRPDRRIYVHMAGQFDYYRLDGVVRAYLLRKLTTEFESDLIGRPWKNLDPHLRRELEKGV